MTSIASDTYSCVAAPIQYAAVAAYVNFDGGNALSISKEVPSELEFSMKDLGDCADPVKHGINKIIEWINE